MERSRSGPCRFSFRPSDDPDSAPAPIAGGGSGVTDHNREAAVGIALRIDEELATDELQVRRDVWVETRIRAHASMTVSAGSGDPISMGAGLAFATPSGLQSAIRGYAG